MTISTPPADLRRAPPPAFAPPPSRRGRAGAFTLTEVMIATVLSSVILAAILSTFLALGRTGFRASAYAEMNSTLRNAVERFNHDVRLASDLRWTDSRRLTLVFPAGLGPAVTYAFEPAADALSPGRLVRLVENQPAEVLVRGVSPDFAFARYRLPDPGADLAPSANNDLETKLLEIRLRAVRSAASAPSASQLALSARCVMRNKSATQ